jgi:hypothetical protein
MNTLSLPQLRDIIKATRAGSAKTASNASVDSMTDANGETTTNTTAKGEEPGLAAQKPANSTTSTTGIQSSVPVSNEVGNGAPSALNGDTTANTISETDSLKSKVAKVLQAVSGKPSTPAPAVTPVATPTPTETTTKVSNTDIEKIASVLATSAGRKFVQSQLQAELGAEAAEEMIKRACEHVVQMDTAANAEAAQAKVAAEVAAAYEALPVHERIIAVKTAAVMEKLAATATPEQLAYIQGGHAAAVQYLQSCKPVAKTAEAMPPEGGAMPPEAMPAPIDEASGAMPEEAPPAEGSSPQLEEIVAALEQLVQSGQATPEQAQQILQAIMGDSPEGAAVEAAPAEAEEMAKTASAFVDEILKPA